ncbi:MAG: lipoate--protein ligase [Clostridia bacterium]|nr:lipoate--protein ligase [Clostridia bacterium]
MITNSRVLITDTHDPHSNLALEDALTRASRSGLAVLLLWQNANTVVIGAGQNAWRECDCELLKKDGGTLARRSSGGGAVYHDLGNLNFSFIMPREDYDVRRQLSVVVEAVRALGINALPTGRNDITVDGRKFSGNAFRIMKNSAVHHGTILVSSDMSLVGRYLRVNREKLASKGVKSVPSRVVNLSSLANVSVADVQNSLIRAFCREYFTCPVEKLENSRIDGFGEAFSKYSDPDWIYGASPEGRAGMLKRFDWGEVEIDFKVVSGHIAEVRAFTDAMDEALADKIKSALEGSQYGAEEMRSRLYAALDMPFARDVAEWVCDI